VGTLQAHDRMTCTAMSPVRHSGCDRCCCLQGNCAGAPPSAASLGLSGASLLPLLPYQCLLIADVNLLDTELDSQLWLDGVYVRYRRTGRFPLDSSGYHFYGFIFSYGSLWMTAVTLQGDGDGILDCEKCGVDTSFGNVYAEGALLVCHNAWCSSCARIAAPQHLLPPHRACAIRARPPARALPCPARPAPTFCAGV
jgi:hypothetical protein